MLESFSLHSISAHSPKFASRLAPESPSSRELSPNAASRSAETIGIQLEMSLCVFESQFKPSSTMDSRFASWPDSRSSSSPPST